MPIFFALSIGGKGVLGSENRIGEESWGVATDHVYVRSHDVLRVKQAHDTGYHTAPVAALRDCRQLVSGLFANGG